MPTRKTTTRKRTSKKLALAKRHVLTTLKKTPGKDSPVKYCTDYETRGFWFDSSDAKYSLSTVRKACETLEEEGKLFRRPRRGRWGESYYIPTAEQKAERREANAERAKRRSIQAKLRKLGLRSADWRMDGVRLSYTDAQKVIDALSK